MRAATVRNMQIGFIGLGNMGNPMAASLLRGGHQLTITDLRQDAAADLLAAGAVWADSAAAVAAASEVVFLSLPKPPDVVAVVTGANGVLSGMKAGSTLIDLSTNSPTVVRDLDKTCAAAGVKFLDCPVSGGVRGARKATLALMAGGDEALFDETKPLLELIGSNVFYCGPTGAGNVAKLVNNMLAFIGMMGMTEGMVLGAKAGIDPNILWKIVKASSGNTFVWEGGGRAILMDKLAPSFSTTLASKDIGLATELGAEYGVDLPMGRAAEALLLHFRDNGFEAEDVLATVKENERKAGVQVRGTWQE